jgi:hypothetical protein
LALTALSLTPCHPPSASVLSLSPFRLVSSRCRGIFILAPMIGKKRNENEAAPEEGKKSDGESRLYGFRAVYVFDRLSRDLWPSLCALDGCRACHFGRPLDSTENIISQLVCPAQRFPMQMFQLSPSFALLIRVLSANAG